MTAEPNQMTSETKTKQPSKRFAKLEAIPAHERMPRGAKSVIATLYIKRTTTLKATAAFLVVVGGAAFATTFLPNGEVPKPGVEIVSVSTPAKPVVKEPTSDTSKQPPVEKPPIVALPGVAVIEDKPKSVALPTVAADAKPPEQKSVEVVKKTPETVAAAPVSPVVRQIIPVAEGLDLYRKPDTDGPPHVTAPMPEQAEAKAPFTLPTTGIPSEDELSSFLPAAPVATHSEQQPENTEIAVIPPEEDMSPTIALPDVVPAPAARPEAPIAAGQPVEFRIDQGQGIKSGFWLGDRTDPKARRFFVIVTAYLASGEKTNWKFTNIADGSAADTDHMAVEVSEDQFIALAKEAKADGMVKDPVLGRGETGSKAPVKWRIQTIRGNLLAGWEK